MPDTYVRCDSPAMAPLPARTDIHKDVSGRPRRCALPARGCGGFPRFAPDGWRTTREGKRMTHAFIAAFTMREVESYVKVGLPGMGIDGSVARGSCPFHSGKPGAFVLNLPSGDHWRCLACNRHGSLIELEAELTAVRAARAEVLRLVGLTPEAAVGHPEGR